MPDRSVFVLANFALARPPHRLVKLRSSLSRAFDFVKTSPEHVTPTSRRGRQLIVPGGHIMVENASSWFYVDPPLLKRAYVFVKTTPDKSARHATHGSVRFPFTEASSFVENKEYKRQTG
jgi:hypothetical protein